MARKLYRIRTDMLSAASVLGPAGSRFREVDAENAEAGNIKGALREGEKKNLLHVKAFKIFRRE